MLPQNQQPTTAFEFTNCRLIHHRELKLVSPVGALSGNVNWKATTPGLRLNDLGKLVSSSLLLLMMKLMLLMMKAFLLVLQIYVSVLPKSEKKNFCFKIWIF